MLLVAALAAAVHRPAAALDPQQPLPDMSHTRWTSREGAPGNVTSLAQTRDGTLWVGSQTGLFRFDGVRFERFEPPSAERAIVADVSSMLATPDGALWVGMRLGGIHRIVDGRMTSFGLDAGLPRNSVMALAQDQAGTIWAGTTVGLYRLAGSTWTVAGAPWKLPATHVASLAVDGKGTLWADIGGQLFSLAAGARTFASSDIRGNGNLVIDQRGQAWFAEYDRGLINVERPWAVLGGYALGSTRDDGAGGALFDRDGGIWIGISASLARLPDARQVPLERGVRARIKAELLSPEQKLSGSDVYAMLEDREGSIWLGTGAGLDRFRANKLHRVVKGDHRLAGAAIAAAPDGGVWVGAQSSGLYRVDRAGRLAGTGLMNREINEYGITALAAPGAGGTPWVAAHSWLYQGASPDAPRIALPDMTPQYEAQQVTFTKDGTAWIAQAHAGLFRREKDRWRKQESPSFLADSVPTALMGDTQGRLWLGCPGDRIVELGDGEPRVFTSAQGVDIGAGLAFLERQGRIWAAGSAGLAALIDDRFKRVRGTLADDFVGTSGLVSDRNGDLWLNGADGIRRIAAADIDRFLRDPDARVPSEKFDAQDGLDGVPEQLRPVPTAVVGTDGRLWFTTTSGLFWIDPDKILRNPLPPPVRVNAVVADGVRYAASAAPAALPQGTHSLQIDYAAQALRIPERVGFRYRLEGIDTDWQDAGSRRQAFYSNLGPGNYRFQVIASNEDGVWNRTGATMQFSISPSFVQSRLFMVLCSGIAVVLVYAMYRLRVSHVATRLRRGLEERLQERERIARELHDTLLQSTQGLVFTYQGLAGRLPREDPLRMDMEAALDRTEGVLGEARDRVRDLRSASHGEQDLAQAIAGIGRELSLDDGFTFKVEVQGTPRPLTRAARDELYRVVREALLNAARHARASAIDVEIVFGSRTLVIGVRDDGSGIEPQVLRTGARPGHWGLTGMRERASRIGAALDILSGDGTGTEVRLSVPANLVYETQMHRMRRWPLPFARTRRRPLTGQGTPEFDQPGSVER